LLAGDIHLKDRHGQLADLGQRPDGGQVALVSTIYPILSRLLFGY
jgi:hypothetical protein